MHRFYSGSLILHPVIVHVWLYTISVYMISVTTTTVMLMNWCTLVKLHPTPISSTLLANTFFQLHKRRCYTWRSPDGQHRNQIDYILCSQRWRSSIQSAKTRLGADCGSDHELLIAKFRCKMKKVGKTSRPFRYGLNQIAYDYTVEVRNRFKGLDLTDRA